MIKIMFLCTGNSCRSQMAEGFARVLGKGTVEAHSAGLIAAGLHPRASVVMKEAGIDISKQKSKEIDEALLRTMDVVVTLCASADKYCPWTPPDVRRLNWPVRDPVATIGGADEVMKDFRRARDEIKEKVQELVATVREQASVA
jgi:arsenate reductase